MRLKHRSSYVSKLDKILLEALKSGIITKTVYDGLKVAHSVVPTLYLTPKIHKDQVKPPGRPIISGSGSLSEPVCRFLDFFLRPILESVLSYIRDSMDVLRHLEDLTLEAVMFLVSCDVESLYTCIDHSHGLRSVEFYVCMRRHDPTINEPVVICIATQLLIYKFVVQRWGPLVPHRMRTSFWVCGSMSQYRLTSIKWRAR